MIRLNRQMRPELGLLCKLGSIAVHADEMTGAGGHEFDMAALRQLLDDPEVKDWIKAMADGGLLPVKR